MAFKLLFCLKLVLFNVPTAIPMAYMYQDNESKTTLKITCSILGGVFELQVSSVNCYIHTDPEDNHNLSSYQDGSAVR